VPNDGTHETQYQFLGAIQEQKPLRDWIQEVLNTCLGYFTFAFGKLRFGVRENSGATEMFGLGYIVHDSLRVEALDPKFNHLTINFGDKGFGWLNNPVVLCEIDHALRAG
jgi:hypothetical protein